MLGLAIVHDRLVLKLHVSLQICVLQTRVLLTKKSPIFANGGFSTPNCPHPSFETASVPACHVTDVICNDT
jgi:hypothetical protein